MTAVRGWWHMPCWNALSADQQTRLIEHGNLEFGYQPEGDGCQRGAEVAIETQWDAAPGPRFYCLPCAVAALTQRRQGLLVNAIVCDRCGVTVDLPVLDDAVDIEAAAGWEFNTRSDERWTCPTCSTMS